MQCPLCGQIRPRKLWKRSQWLRVSPITEYFNCCKLCSADGLWVARANLENALMQMQQLLARVFQNGLRGQMRRFIVQWMDALPAHVRKHLSYAGALRRRQIFGHSQVVQVWSGDRQHEPLSGETFFDPGNAVYYLAFSMIWPRLLNEYQWNAVTVGDIWESLLGFAYLHLHQSEVPQSVAALAHWIDAYIFEVYRFVCYAKDGSEWWDFRSFDDCFRFVYRT